jgi:hypothetical protein
MKPIDFRLMTLLIQQVPRIIGSQFAREGPLSAVCALASPPMPDKLPLHVGFR